jgi:hypothetical protein
MDLVILNLILMLQNAILVLIYILLLIPFFVDTEVGEVTEKRESFIYIFLISIFGRRRNDLCPKSSTHEEEVIL